MNLAEVAGQNHHTLVIAIGKAVGIIRPMDTPGNKEVGKAVAVVKITDTEGDRIVETIPANNRK